MSLQEIRTTDGLRITYEKAKLKPFIAIEAIPIPEAIALEFDQIDSLIAALQQAKNWQIPETQASTR